MEGEDVLIIEEPGNFDDVPVLFHFDIFEGIEYTTPPDDDEEEAGPLTTSKLNVEVEEIDEDSKQKQLPAEENIEIEEDEGTTSEVSPINTNIIILGSKPCKTRRVKIVLDDVEPYLKASERFCMKCLILFPDKVALDSHEKKYHTAEDKTLPLELACESNQEIGIEYTTPPDDDEEEAGPLTTSKLNVEVEEIDEDSKQKQLPAEENIEIEEDEGTTSEVSPINTNIIILGSKPCKTRRVKIVLDDVEPYLKASERFCMKCLILFPDKVALDSHKKKYHTAEDKTLPLELACESNQVLNMMPKVKDDMKKKQHNTECFHCKKSFTTQESLIDHLYSILQPKNEPRNRCQSDEGYYRCYICSYYFTNTKLYLNHLTSKHNVNSYCNQQQKEEFDSMCKYCSKNYNSSLGYNIHLGAMHKEHVNSSGKQMPKKPGVVERSGSIPLNPKQESNAKSKVVPQLKPLLKSALFKCAKCDIHFLSSKVAGNHAEHIEMLIHWKCSICRRILKNEDKILHGEQHKYSQEFIVYDLHPNTFTPILFNCLNCKVHFDEDSYFNHHSTCKNETPTSVFCIICDVFIDKSISKMHKSEHVSQNIKSTDYIIVESDILATCNSNPKTGEDSVAVTTKSPSIAKMRVKGNFKRKGIKIADIPQKRRKVQKNNRMW